MKTIDDFLILKPSRMPLKELAERCKVSSGRISQLRHAQTIPPELALDLEDATEGFLDAAELSPVIARARQPRREFADASDS